MAASEVSLSQSVNLFVHVGSVCVFLFFARECVRVCVCLHSTLTSPPSIPPGSKVRFLAETLKHSQGEGE